MASGRRLTATRLIVYSFLANGLVIIMLPVVNSFPLLVFGQMLGGLASGMQMTLLMGLCTKNIPASRKSSAMGFYQAIYGIGMVTGPVLVGSISDVFDLNLGFVIIGTISFISALLAAAKLAKFTKSATRS